MASKRKLTNEDYRRLLAFRTGLRRFLHWSKSQAAKVGLPPMQHQLLLAIRGHDDQRGPTVQVLAEYLLLKHHSTVELIDRAEAAGLVERYQDEQDRRLVRMRCTPKGLTKLEQLSITTFEELRRTRRDFSEIWDGLEDAASHD